MPILRESLHREGDWCRKAEATAQEGLGYAMRLSLEASDFEIALSICALFCYEKRGPQRRLTHKEMPSILLCLCRLIS